MSSIKIYTDGSCFPNPGGCGGYAAVILYPDNKLEYVIGGRIKTTNNRMELMAIIAPFLEEKINKEDRIIIYSDSRYVVNGINLWLNKWKANGKTMKNMDLWDKIYIIKKEYHINAKWIKGHAGNKYNEIADMLAEESRLLIEREIADHS